MHTTYPDPGTVTETNLLKQQGNQIATALSQQGYQTRFLNADLIAWEVTKEGEDWWVMLTWLPRPASQWRLLPVDNRQHQAEIYQIIEQTIGGRR